MKFSKRCSSVCTVAVIAASAIFTARAQTPQPNGSTLPSFEVTSIKINTTPPAVGEIRFPGPSGEFTASISTKILIVLAYNVKDFQISGAPNWTAAQVYDIDAKEDSSTAAKLAQVPAEERVAQVRLMLQSLLADRFHLAIHAATTDVPMFSLVVSKAGRLLGSHGDCEPGHAAPAPAPAQPGQWPVPSCMGRNLPGHIAGLDMPISMLASDLSSLLGETVNDKTGLTANYNVVLNWTPDADQPRLPPGAPFPQPDPNGPSLQDALEDQLGLKLVPTKGPVDTIVIDHIEEPTPN